MCASDKSGYQSYQREKSVMAHSIYTYAIFLYEFWKESYSANNLHANMGRPALLEVNPGSNKNY